MKLEADESGIFLADRSRKIHDPTTRLITIKRDVFNQLKSNRQTSVIQLVRSKAISYRNDLAVSTSLNKNIQSSVETFASIEFTRVFGTVGVFERVADPTRSRTRCTPRGSRPT